MTTLPPVRMRVGSWRVLRYALLAAAIAPALSGCVSGGVDDTLALDTVTTGSIPAATGLKAGSDEAALAEAVADIDLARTPNAPFAWANAATGSTGVISALEENSDPAGAVCRAFTTTIHRFDGIALYEGRQCREGSKPWNLSAFGPVS